MNGPNKGSDRVYDMSTLRRTYARGMFDGLAQAGISNPGEFMNDAKLKSVMDGQSSIAKKILEFCPYDEAASPQQILAEMKRTTGSAPDFNIFMGCLRTLTESKLLLEKQRGFFMRVSFKEHPVPPKKNSTSAEVVPIKAPPAVQRPSPLERLSSLSTTLRQLATEIDDVALEVTDEISRIEGGSAKLRQLQELLKSIG